MLLPPLGRPFGRRESGAAADDHGRFDMCAPGWLSCSAENRWMVNLSFPPRRRRSGKMVKGRTVRGTILGYKRSKSNQYETTSLVQIEGVNTRED